MTRPMIKFHNVEQDEIIEREMNDIEYAQYLIDVETSQAKADAEAAKESARTALLAKLGITADEAALLLGGN